MRFVFLLFFISLTTLITAQISQKDNVAAKNSIKTADKLAESGKYEAAIGQLDNSLKLFSKYNAWEKYYSNCDKLITWTALSKGFDAAVSLNEHILESCSEHLGKTHISYIYLQHIRAKYLYKAAMDIDAADAFTKTASAYAKYFGKKSHEKRIEFYIDWAAFLTAAHQFEAALQKLKEAVYMAEQLYGDESEELMMVSEKAALLAFEMEQYSTCRQLGRRAINAKRKIFKKEDYSFVPLYLVLGKSSIILNEAATATAYAEKGLELCETFKKTKTSDAADFYQISADAKWLSGSLEEAVDLIQTKLKPLALSLYGQNSAELAEVHRSLGIYSIDLNDYKKAEENLKTAVKISKSINGNKGDVIAELYKNLSDCSKRNNRYSEAQNYIFAALSAVCISCGKELTTTKDIISALEKETILDPVQSLYLIYEYLNLQYVQLQSDKAKPVFSDIEKLIKATAQYQFKVQQSRITTSEEAAFKDAQAQGILCMLPLLSEMAKAEKSNKKLKLAYELMLQHKQLKYQLAMQTLTNVGFGNIPDSLIHAFQKHQEHFLAAEREWALAKLRKDESAAETAKSKMLRSKRETAEWEKMMSEAFPKYFQSIRKPNFLNLAEIQQNLDAKTVLLDYFVRGEQIWLFQISTGDVKLLELDMEGEELLDMMDELYRSFTDPLMLKRAPKSAKTEYIELADLFYKILVLPALSSLPKKVDKLLIAPDGLLYYLPFETMISSVPKADAKYTDFNFLIKKYAIAYTYSGFPVNNTDRKKVKGNNLLALFAEYETILHDHKQHNLSFTNLSGLKEESEIFPKSLIISKLTAKSAKKSNLLTAIKTANIIHLSAQLFHNERNYLNPSLVLSDFEENDQDNFLFANEITNLHTDAELIVLSAANAGFGRMPDGEAMQLMSAAFEMAGSRSMLHSLWTVNHKARITILKSYYKYLAEGMRKDKALQAAKLDYLKSVEKDEEAHPMFWAAFVQSGDLLPLGKSKSGTSYLIWIVLGCIAIGSGIRFYLYRKSKSAA